MKVRTRFSRPRPYLRCVTWYWPVAANLIFDSGLLCIAPQLDYRAAAHGSCLVKSSAYRVAELDDAIVWLSPISVDVRGPSGLWLRIHSGFKCSQLAHRLGVPDPHILIVPSRCGM